jgi:hypothetical protein
MKIKLAIIALVLMGLSACTQRTCPTYAEVDSTNPQIEEVA